MADCIRHLADNLPNGVILNIAQCNFTADRIEFAWLREKAELESKLANTETARKFFARRIDSAKEQIAELREFSNDRLGYSRKYPDIVRRITKIDIGPCPYDGWDGEYFRIHFEKEEGK